MSSLIRNPLAMRETEALLTNLGGYDVECITIWKPISTEREKIVIVFDELRVKDFAGIEVYGDGAPNVVFREVPLWSRVRDISIVIKNAMEEAYPGGQISCEGCENKTYGDETPGWYWDDNGCWVCPTCLSMEWSQEL